ncbi:hypothetical protein G5V58_16645 [Nocardioides anomalus]|uniref:Uncharacterized protein n=1 Tax=Nocardioides anomalus TaxID=2712223 RepID=A0A6G6WG50_9ACTN|nr:hypothetical protein [Nocardioides anomalus]QIG44186.1 hypothetical protein G5V58_16645 [Nocardioides anomalus]
MNSRAALTLVAVLALLTSGCTGDDSGASGPPGSSGSSAPSPSESSLFTLTPVTLPPEPPPSGKLKADIEQSSRDGAAGRFQVWVDNDTDTLITPTRVTYTDARFRTPLTGTRLRDIPSQARRGFQFLLPGRPACGREADGGTVTVDYTVDGDRRTATVPVEDEADVIQRTAAARCLELSIDSIAKLSWADEVTADGDGGEGSVGTMTLVVDTTGRRGPTLVIDTIAGNPVLSPGDLGVYDAHLTVRGDDPPQRVAVPLRPTRCDAHAFGESGSFAAFALNVHVDGQAGQFILRMGPTAAASALEYAKASCGFLTSIGGGEG